MSLIQLANAWLSFSDAPLLDHAELTINANERVCIVGRNGAGKSTLLKILSKELPLDDGQVIYQQSLRVARLAQDPPQQLSGTVFDYVAEGLAQQAELLKNYHHQLALVSEQPTEQHLQQLAQLQDQLEQQDAWQLETRIDSILNQLNLPADALLANLSGGWLRKAALARALVNQPQVLLLDEPTNHLDIQTIDELEQFLFTSQFSIVFISHDRAFISKLATRIVDLDRGKLVSWPGNYQTYLQGKEEELRVEAAQQAEFDKKLAQEEAWIRQGIKARRTRNEGRVRALKALRQERRQRREVIGNVAMTVDSGTRSGKLIFELEKVSYQLSDKTIISDFSAQVLRGDKIALIGPNGCGKSTLLKLLLQEHLPSTGTVQVGTQLSVAYFDQHRLALDLEKSVMDNVADGKQDIEINGRSRHVLGYLQEFLFPPKRSMVPVKALSGGEKNRLLLAKLFLKPSNLLILDEPTNDLDVETLELLEELIANYQGTVLLVSHDRQFVDNIVTECWIFAGNGRIERYPGGYQDAWQQYQQVKNAAAAAAVHKNVIAPEKAKSTKRLTVKLSYQQQRELEQLPSQIENLEQQISQLQQQIAKEDFFNLPHGQTTVVLAQLAQVEQQLEQAFEQWEWLESKAKGQ